MIASGEFSESPWPKGDGQGVLFLFDAATRVEQELLEDWIRSTKAPETNNGTVNQITVPITRMAEKIGLEPFIRKLSVAGDTLVAPLRVVWLPPARSAGGTPRVRDLVLGDFRKPGAIWARRILKHSPERVRCIAGKPATIEQLRNRFARHEKDGSAEATELFASFVVRQASLVLDIAERRLQGSRYKVPRFVSDSLRSSPKFIEAIEELSVKLNKSSEELLRESRIYLREMVAIPSTFFIDCRAKFDHFILSLGYEKKIVYDEKDIDRIRRIVRENPSLLLWTHKTYLDGSVLPAVLFENDFPLPHMFGGVNMSFAGLGFLLRRSGAIFIRRSFQDNALYKLVLRHYIGYLMEKRFPMNWAFEGTRSRVGKLMPPRYGLLKYVLEAAHATGAENVHIIPVSISYDLIRDVADYAKEQSGTTKKAESLQWFIGYLSSLRKPMGRIYLDFGEPVVLERAPSPDDRLALSKIAFEVAVKANNVTPLTLPSLVSMVLLGAAPQALTSEEIIREVRALVQWARRRNIRMAGDFHLDRLDQMREQTDIMIEIGLITRYDAGPEVIYGIAPDQHLVASFYRNTVIHYFVNKAILELALIKASDAPSALATSVFWTEAEDLRDLFKFEFFYSPTKQFFDELRDELSLHSEGWEDQLEQGGQAIPHLLSSMQPLVAHATLLHFVEAYRVVADVLARQKPEESLDEKACVAQAMKYGRQAYLQRRISSEASIARLLFENGYKLLDNSGLTSVGGDEVAQRRLALAQEFRELARRLERLKAMTVAERSNATTSVSQMEVLESNI